MFFLPHVENERVRIWILVKTLWRAKVVIAGITIVLILWGIRSLSWDRFIGKVFGVFPFFKGISFAGWVGIGFLFCYLDWPCSET